jgi:hypothetical protein
VSWPPSISRRACRPWPGLAWPTLSWHDLWVGALYLALHQLPLSFGNALTSISEDNNQLFPDLPLTE